MKAMIRTTFLLFVSWMAAEAAFAPLRPVLTTARTIPTPAPRDEARDSKKPLDGVSPIAMAPRDEQPKSKKPFDENLRSKLVSEAIAPWRTVRLFLYGSLGASALVGGLITLTGTLAALQGVRPDLDLTEQVRSVDFCFFCG